VVYDLHSSPANTKVLGGNIAKKLESQPTYEQVKINILVYRSH